jgi:hypothetical protein
MTIWYGMLWSFGIFFPFWFVVPRKIWQPWLEVDVARRSLAKEKSVKAFLPLLHASVV